MNSLTSLCVFLSLSVLYLGLGLIVSLWHPWLSLCLHTKRWMNLAGPSLCLFFSLLLLSRVYWVPRFIVLINLIINLWAPQSFLFQKVIQSFGHFLTRDSQVHKSILRWCMVCQYAISAVKHNTKENVDRLRVVILSCWRVTNNPNEKHNKDKKKWDGEQVSETYNSTKNGRHTQSDKGWLKLNRILCKGFLYILLGKWRIRAVIHWKMYKHVQFVQF